MWFALAAAALLLTGLAGVMERRRARRAEPDRVGWVPWGGVIVIALFAFAGAMALALH